MDYLVTGGAGFIGSNLVENLLDNGHSVHVIDNLSSGFESNLQKHFSNNQFKFSHCPLESYNFDSDIIKYKGVYHLAAQASVPFSIDNFAQSSIGNLSSSVKLLEFCSRQKIPIVYASSSAVYGNLPNGDEAGDIELLSPYSADKFALEIYAKQCWMNYKLRSVGYRFFNVYGPRQDPKNPYSGVISIFVDRIRNDETINIYGGEQTRDFIYITDIITCLTRAMMKLSSSEIPPLILNLGTGQSISINKLVTVLSEVIGANPRIKVLDYVDGDPLVSNCDLSQFNQHFGSFQMVNLSKGLRNYISWLSKNGNIS